MLLIENLGYRQKSATTFMRECSHDRLNLRVVMAWSVTKRNADRLGRSFHGPQHLTGVRRGLWVVEDRHGFNRRAELGEHLQLLGVERRIVTHEAGQIAAR